MGDEGTVAGEKPVEPAEESAPVVVEQEPASTGTAGQAQSQQSARETEGATTETGPEEPAVTASATEGSENADFERTLAGAWVIQLGSFGDEGNARRLRDRVRERGYGAHLQEVTRGEQRLLRVFSGPFAEKAEAEKAKAVLDEAFGIKSLVTRGED
jgi:DedD protein